MSHCSSVLTCEMTSRLFWQWPGATKLPPNFRNVRQDWGLWPFTQSLQGQDFVHLPYSSPILYSSLLKMHYCFRFSAGWLLHNARPDLGASALDCARADRWGPRKPARCGPNKEQQHMVRHWKRERIYKMRNCWKHRKFYIIYPRLIIVISM